MKCSNGFVDLIDRTVDFDTEGWEEVKSQFLFDASDEGLLTINGTPNGLSSSSYGPHLLVPVTGATAGDFDTDGDVDAVDLAQWQGDFGINNESDADNDGDSDGADFLAWQRNLGAGALSASTAVPEPSCLAMLVLGGALLLGVVGTRQEKRPHAEAQRRRGKSRWSVAAG